MMMLPALPSRIRRSDFLASRAISRSSVRTPASRV
jgi:hypothetical protein